MAPRSAAIAGSYNSHRDSNGRRNSHFYRLSNNDMPLFVRILQQGVPPHEVQERIRSLPRHLRASGLHKSPSSTTGKVQPGYLCDVHKRLKKGLCYEVMSLVQHEISRIGSFTYSIVVRGELEAWEEMQARQLEPVPQMYMDGFDQHESAPEGHQPIYPGFRDEKGVYVQQWSYEVSQCPACMLSRIGADDKVLFALLAGLAGRISRRSRGRVENLKSRRIRFVKEWLEARENGPGLVSDALYLGRKMQDIKRQQKRRAREERMREDRARDMQAREAHDIRIEISGHRGMDRPDRPVSRTASDMNGYRQSVIDIDISEPYVPQYHQASRRPTRNGDPPIDQDTAIRVEPFRPGSWRLRNNIPYSKEAVVSAGGARGIDRQSDRSVPVGVDISEPFIPAPRYPSNHGETHREPDSDELFIPASTQRSTTLPSATQVPVRGRARRSGTVFARSMSSRYFPSIAPSFASNVSLSDLQAPSVDASLVPSPLRTSSRRLPTFPTRSVDRVSRPHPLSIYGTSSGGYNTVPGARYADVSPPSTPIHTAGHAHAQYDASPPSSPEPDEFETSPPVTPVMHSRPVTIWSALYEN